MKHRRIRGLGAAKTKEHRHDYSLVVMRAIKKLDSLQEQFDSLEVEDCADGAKKLMHLTRDASSMLCEVAQVDPYYHPESVPESDRGRARKAVSETLNFSYRVHARPATQTFYASDELASAKGGLVHSIEKARETVDRCYADAARQPYRHVPAPKSLVSGRQEPLFPGASRYRSPLLEF